MLFVIIYGKDIENFWRYSVMSLSTFKIQNLTNFLNDSLTVVFKIKPLTLFAI